MANSGLLQEMFTVLEKNEEIFSIHQRIKSQMVDGD